jgi:hypothetical protein
MKPWTQLDHQQLWWFDIVEFQGRRVPKLVFVNREKTAIAEVFVLRKSVFDLSDLASAETVTPNRIHVERDDESDFVYLVGSQDNIGAFLRKDAQAIGD